jgi:Tfp pilus assembly protein PilZ
MSPYRPPDAPNPHFRAFSRRPVRLPAMVEGFGTRHAAIVVDLGLGGVCVEINGVMDVGTPVRLAIEAPHRWDAVRLEGHVVWLNPAAREGGGRIGIAFNPTDGSTLRVITELLATQAYA